MSYFPQDYENPFELTENEMLWDTVRQSRMIKLIKDADEVWNFHRTRNNYGEFRFITLIKDDEVLTFYGLGYHEPRGENLVNTWHFFRQVGDFSDPRKRDFESDRQCKNVHPLFSILQAEYVEMQGQEEPEPTERQKLHRELALISDDDGAAAMLDDFGIA